LLPFAADQAQHLPFSAAAQAQVFAEVLVALALLKLTMTYLHVIQSCVAYAQTLFPLCVPAQPTPLLPTLTKCCR
jgi:hypothetical protein